MGKHVFFGLLIGLLLPYIITLAWTGTIEGTELKLKEEESSRRILMDRGNGSSYMDVEEYLVGVVSRQIPADFGQEALRAQAVAARTYIYKQMSDQKEIKESELNMNYLEEKQLQAVWGGEHFAEYYKNVESAVNTTRGMVMTYEEQYIDPMFHRASTGRTRNGDDAHPYLCEADSREDVEAEEFLKVMIFEKQEFAQKVSQIPDSGQITAEQVPSTIQIISRDDSGYVEQLQIGGNTYTGDLVQNALDLPSCCFTIEEYEGKIRVVCKGIGHGYGLSQYGARAKAAQGWKAEDILSYFYKNIVLISE